MQYHGRRRRRLGADVHQPPEQDCVEENDDGGAKGPKFGALIRAGQGGLLHRYSASVSIFSATSKSRSVSPPWLCVESCTRTLLYRMSISGWCSSSSAMSASLFTKSIACVNSSNSKRRSMCFFSSSHSGRFFIQSLMSCELSRSAIFAVVFGCPAAGSGAGFASHSGFCRLSHTIRNLRRSPLPL